LFVMSDRLKSLNKNDVVFIGICIIGGILVLASYIWVILSFGGDLSSFWGGMPERFFGGYYISMVLSALSYFIFTIFIFLNVSKDIKIKSKSIYFYVNLFYIFLLIPSALWMPLVNFYLENSSSFYWLMIRLVLVLVGLSSFGIFLIILQSGSRKKYLFRILALLSSFYFFFHTGILDALIWPYFFMK